MNDAVEFCLDKLQNRIDAEDLAECLEILEHENSSSSRFLRAYILERLNPIGAYEIYNSLQKDLYWPACFRMSVLLNSDKVPAETVLDDFVHSGSADEFEDECKKIVFELFCLLSELNYGEDDYCLGVACFLGRDFPERKEFGLKLLVDSARKGCKGAQRTVFQIFDTDTCYLSKTASLYWLEMISKFDPSVGVKLANRYLDGVGCECTPENDKKAFAILSSLEKESDRGAINNLGWMLMNGRGCCRDYTAAKRLFERAAEMGSSTSLFHLGEIFENGLGVDANPMLAQKMYMESAEMGNVRAKARLQRLDSV